MMVEIKRLVVVALAALACVGMWGCTDVDFHWSEKRSKAKIVGFVDDSLVMVGDYRYWSEITDEWNGGYSEMEGFGHERLCVYNYRIQEDGPRWCDSLDKENETGAFMGQMTDSVIWGSGLPKSLKLWKIGEKQHEIKLVGRLDGCSDEFRITSVKPWIGGKFIARGEKTFYAKDDSCQYAVLDTVSRTLTYKKLDDSLKWIQKCDDVRAWGKDVYCVVLEGDPMNLYLSKNNDILDSLMQGEPYGWASYTKIGFAGEMLNLGNNVCKIVSDQFSCLEVSIRGNLDFKTEKVTIIY